ncbi:NACHT, LRR and PYD domains-containing protein 3 [Misgurnus anguillicaudatus]|uniref:NACHT, LRR and PYD domains-containing protein 3 n=1 Tax=Misgurnus anguillicaudatus TaxID=75329 RepID=UPI003CCF3454
MPILLKHGSLLDQSSNEKRDLYGPRDNTAETNLLNQRYLIATVTVVTKYQNKNVFFPRHNPTSFEENNKRLKSHIKIRYQCVSEGLAKHGNPTLLNEIYTELYITESESGEISNEHEVRQIETQSRRTTTEETPIKCNDIFKPLPEQDKHIRSVMTKGVAGIGKTVSVQKFILDWAEEKENQDVHLIFPLPFREINLMKDKTLSLLDLLHLFFPETKEMEIFSDEYKVLFIFDGLDECRLSLDFHSSVRLCDVNESTSVDVMLTNLIKGNLFPSSLIWITSRPAAADLIPSECVDRVTEVRGFSDPQKEEYFRKRISDESLSDQIISHLKSSRSLYIMCHIPVFCWISVTVLERILSEAESQEIPKTLTQMYTHFLMAQISIKREKYSQQDDTDKEMIFKLCKLAFEQLMKGNLIFYDEDLRECDIDVAEASVESTSVDVMLINLIKGNLFPSSLIWITSRPAAADLIPSECVDRVTEVRGFSDPQKEEYFRKRISDESLSDQIISHLKSSRSLYIMCHIPVFCWISVTVLEKILREAESLEIPKTLTQMYTHFLMAQISIKRKKYSQQDDTDKVMIFKLGKLAFEHLMKGNLIFYDEDLRECGIDVSEASVYSGLCTQIFREEFGLYQGKVYCFVHLTIQEHLAALYVYLSFINNNMNVFNKKSENPLTMFSLHKCAIDKALQSNSGHLDLLLRFLMGFSIESNHNLLKGPLVKRRHDFQDREKTIKHLKDKICEMSKVCTKQCLILFHCLNELNDRSLVEEIQRYLTSDKLNTKDMPTELWAALVFILLTSDEKFEEFDLSKYGRSDHVLQYLSPVINVSTKAQLQNCNITVYGCARLSFVLTALSNVRELDLSHNNIQDPGVEMLCVGLLKSRHTPLLMASMCDSENVNDQNSTDAYLKLATAGLQDTQCGLESLKLKKCGVTEDGCVQLSSALRSNPSHLRELDLSWNHVGDSGVKHLCDVLEKTECALQILNLNKCGITAEGCAALASALRSNTSGLIELDLSDNNLGDSGVKLISDGLKNPHCKLKILRLSNCSVTKNGVAALAEALNSNPSHLTELDIRGNHLKVSDIHIFSMIQDKVHI